MDKKVKWAVYAIADDPYCGGRLEFMAYKAELQDNNTLVIDGQRINAIEGFRGLAQVK